MFQLQSLTDKTAISLSLLCTIHCLFAPLLAVLLPSIAGIPLEDEIFHLWLAVAVIPISIYALTMGCKSHKRYRVLALGGVGLLILIFTALFGHGLLGEELEKTFTVIGASIIAVGHIWNYRLCRQTACACPESGCKN
jgi:hypothetical protein